MTCLEKSLNSQGKYVTIALPNIEYFGGRKMKKVIAMVLVMVLAFCLCACGSALSAQEKKLVGTWVCEKSGEGFVLCDSGNYVKTDSLDKMSESGDNKIAGFWEVEEGYVIIYTEYYSTSRNAKVYRITENSLKV
jgi:hypothetical protein